MRLFADATEASNPMDAAPHVGRDAAGQITRFSAYLDPTKLVERAD